MSLFLQNTADRILVITLDFIIVYEKESFGYKQRH